MPWIIYLATFEGGILAIHSYANILPDALPGLKMKQAYVTRDFFAVAAIEREIVNDIRQRRAKQRGGNLQDIVNEAIMALHQRRPPPVIMRINLVPQA